MGMSQTGCCCKETCDGTEDICCLLCTVNGGYLDGFQFYLLKRSWVIPPGDILPYVYTPGEGCDSSVGNCNNAEGILRGPYFHHNVGSVDPFKRYYPCSGYYRAVWSCTPGEPATVGMFVQFSGGICDDSIDAGYPIDPHTGRSFSHRFRKDGLPLDWYTDDITLDDDIDPASGVTLTVSPCPETFDLFPVDSETVRFNIKLEARDLIEAGTALGPWEEKYCFALEGSTVCGTPQCLTLPIAYYRYALDDTIVFSVGLTWGSAEYWDHSACHDEASEYDSNWTVYEVCIPFDGGNWPDSWEPPVEEPIGYGYAPAVGGCYPSVRITIEKVEAGAPCPECGGGESPPEDDGTCTTEHPCFEVFVPTGEPGEGYQSLCSLSMDRVSATVVNYSGSCDAPEEFLLPSGNPAVVEVTMIRDEVSRPPGAPSGSKTFRVTITIKDAVTDAVVDEHTFVVSLVCSATWSIYDIFELSGYDPEYTGPTTLEVRIGARCSGTTLNPPTECDPGCWPECVMCPERKTLYVVVSDAPDCCLSGTYALTWVGTGGGGAPTVGYYELPATVGGPIDTCGQITFLRVSCVDASHIMVQLVYLRAEGTEISNLSSPDTLSVICDESGHLESDAIHVPGRSADRESLCGFGSGVGGDIRIVSA